MRRTSSFPVTAAVVLFTEGALDMLLGPPLSGCEYGSRSPRWEKLPGDIVTVASISFFSSWDLWEPTGSSCLTNSILCLIRSSFWLDSDKFCWASCNAFLSWLLQAVKILSTFLEPSRQADSIFMWCLRSSILLSKGDTSSRPKSPSWFLVSSCCCLVFRIFILRYSILAFESCSNSSASTNNLLSLFPLYWLNIFSAPWRTWNRLSSLCYFFPFNLKFSNFLP